MKKYALSLALLVTPFMAFALDTPVASPSSEVKQRVGLTDFTINYSRPSVKDREVFGDLVPFNEVWRTGANASTKLTFNQDIIFGGTRVEAGEYALYTLPGEQNWSVILSTNTDLWGSSGYSPDQDVARVDVIAKKSHNAMETLLITFDHLRNDSAELVLLWDDTRVSVPLQLFTADQVKANIEEAKATIANWSGNNFASAARAYHEYDLDQELALEWIDKAIATNGKAFWWVHTKAKILVALDRKEDAIKAAEQSLQLATADSNGAYIKQNNELLATLR